jgi:putative Holliday junction resolvase
LTDIVREHDVAVVVVGHPLLMSGIAGEKAQDAEAFVERLRAVVPCPVVLWDERLTSVQANRALLEGNVSRRDRRDVVDAAAAALLLQSWLDAQ